MSSLSGRPELPSPAARAPLLRAWWVPAFGDGFGLAVFLAVLAAAVRGVGMLGPPPKASVVIRHDLAGSVAVKGDKL